MKRKAQNNQKNVSVATKLQNLSGKTIAAVVLLSLMALLWGRVLLRGKGGPATANAQDLSELQLQEQQEINVPAPVKFQPVTLAFLKGRHDVLTGDMFSTTNWKAFDFNEKEDEVVSEAEVSSEKDNLEKRHQLNLNKIAKTLALGAVIHGSDDKPAQVFVNDIVLAVGSVLTVKEGPDQYELSLKEIKENEALFTWNKFSITLKITEMVEK